MTNVLPLDLGHLGSVSRRLASVLFAGFPAIAQYARMTRLYEPEGLSLVVRIPCPAGYDERGIEIWVDEVLTPSIGFGPNHAHYAADGDGIAAVLDLLRAIFDGHLLIATDLGGTYDGHAAWLDTGDPMALVAELTSPPAPPALHLKSFSGAEDRTVTPDDLSI